MFFGVKLIMGSFVLFVVNTDPMERPCTHWRAIYFNKQMKGEFFQLVYDFVRRKYRQVHPSLKQDIDFIAKQISRSLIESSKI